MTVKSDKMKSNWMNLQQLDIGLAWFCQAHAVDLNKGELGQVPAVVGLLQGMHHFLYRCCLTCPRHPRNVHAPGKQTQRCRKMLHVLHYLLTLPTHSTPKILSLCNNYQQSLTQEHLICKLHTHKKRSSSPVLTYQPSWIWTRACDGGQE